MKKTFVFGVFCLLLLAVILSGCQDKTGEAYKATQSKQAKCIDSDGPFNFTTYGKVIGPNGKESTDFCNNGAKVNRPRTAVPSCSGNQCAVIDYRCDGNIVTWNKAGCPTGCQNGACAQTTACIDSDKDGYNARGDNCGTVDCNDNNAAIKPSGAETCDGIDNDCDGVIDNNCYEFLLVDSSYNFIDSDIQIDFKYIGTDALKYENKNDMRTLKIPDTAYYDKTRSSYRSTFPLLSTFQVSKTQLDEIFAKYPDGLVPFEFTYRITDKTMAEAGWNEANYNTVFRVEGTIKFVKLEDNHIFKIGVIQVVPPGVNLETLNLCLVKDASLGGTGYVPQGSYQDCAAKWDWGSNAASITTRSIKLTDVLFSQQPYTTIEDVTSLQNQKENKTGSIKTYSLKYGGEFWRNLLTIHGIEETRLGKNPGFEFIFLNPIEKENTLTSSDHALVKQFFSEAVAQNKVDTSVYDFVIYIQYIPEPINSPHFTRSFVADRRAYISFPLDGSDVIYNTAFFTVVHEMGHMLFKLNDLYDGLAIKYPVGVPDPVHFPQKKACIMAKNFGYAKASATLVSRYDTDDYDPQDIDMGIDRFYTQDPANFVLCVDDILKIRKGVENPLCSAADFYAGNCGDCTSMNYLRCTKT